MKLKIAAHQINFISNKKQNLEKIISTIEKTKAQLHVFPEYSMGTPTNGLTQTFVKKNAEQINGPFISKILEKTKEHQTAVTFTVFLTEKNQIFNTAILAENGKIKATYKKIHLFDALGHKESNLFSPGTKIATAKIQNFTVGLAICFDLRFPELFRALTYKGAELFIVPSAWYMGKYKKEQWQLLTKTRAHENNTYLIGVNQTLPQFIGNSIITSPFATTIKQANTQETTLTAELDKKTLLDSKNQIPTIKLSKPKLYKTL